MARVSLILPTTPEFPEPLDQVAVLRSGLEADGHEVEVVLALCSRISRVGTVDGVFVTRSENPGLAPAAVAGLEVAGGDLLVLLDPSMGYTLDDVRAVLRPVEAGEAELAVASRLARGSGLARSAVGRLLKTLVRSSDPLSGLMAMTRDSVVAAFDHFRAVGRKFSFEMLAKVPGRCVDIPARPGPRLLAKPFGWDDVRHLKRLSDHRFGNLSRLLQFCVVGASGMIVDLAFYALFQVIFFRFDWLATNPVPPTRVPFALAISRSLAIGVALVWNFSLNRRLTFSDTRGGSRVLRQFLVYALSNAPGVALSLATSLGLPSRVPFFRQHRLAAAVVGIVLATGFTFSMSRWLVFRRLPEPLEGETEPEADPARKRAPSGRRSARSRTECAGAASAHSNSSCA